MSAGGGTGPPEKEPPPGWEGRAAGQAHSTSEEPHRKQKPPERQATVRTDMLGGDPKALRSKKARRAIAKAAERDRDWFATHHGRRFRIRPPAPVELAMMGESPGLKPMILVAQVEPGQRFRLPFRWREGEVLLNADAIGEALAETLMPGLVADILGRWA